MSRRLRRGIYVLPSLFTLGNLFLGFWAIILGLSGRFQTAALLIFVAAILDALDGRIARLTNTESEFGREFDSMADVLTFGSAPALLAYLWGLQGFGRLGWLVPLFFLVCTATRLARFNVQTSSVDNRFFVGLPTPAAAGAIASLLFLTPVFGDARPWQGVAMLVALLTIGSLMISTLRYPSFKRIDLKQRRSYRLLLPLTAILLVVLAHPPAFFLSAAAMYTSYGPIAWLVGRRAKPASEPAGEPRPSSGLDDLGELDEMDPNQA